MESKLPKPSTLKKPLISTNSILPIDRIKAYTSGFGTIRKVAGSSSNLNNLHPLTRDLSNLQNGVSRRDRAVSPDYTRLHEPSRTKMRRSRSACDIREMRSLKRTDTTLAPIPAKTSRMISSSNTTTTNSTIGGASLARPPRVGTSTATTTAASTTKRAVASKPVVGRTNSTINSKKPLASQTSTSTTGAGKPINKRIPPYDFKARYNDLLEKHKVLKEKYEENREQMGNLESLPEQLEDSQAQLFSTRDELKNAQIEIDRLQKLVKSQTIKIDSITNCLEKTKSDLDNLRDEYNKIFTEHTALSTEIVDLRSRTKNLTDENEQLKEDLVVCREQVFRSNMERKELHNTVMDLRGNIRVFCRVRPPLECEQNKILCNWNYMDEATLEIQNPEFLASGAKNKTSSHVFSFDHVFHPRSTQDDIFEMVSPLIQSALDGYNICIFAYGQTGSGKTYTMDGVSSNVGVIPRTVDLLFDSIDNYQRLGWEYEIKVTFLEIYNEVLFDLLSNEPKEMEIRMAKNNKNDIYVSNITQETVTSAARLRQLMHIAKMNRATASTAGNERSSRSHAVTKIELTGTHAEKNEISIGSINLVDLAGSESPKTSTRMNETKNINRSLSELTNVILALLQKQDHIPYRNSKLTHLLMPSLGGNSKTLMFINVAPFQDCFVESVKSLRFASSVNSCKMAKAKRNKFLNTSCSSSSFEK